MKKEKKAMSYDRNHQTSSEGRNTIVSGVLWRFSERIGAQGITLIVSVILARILEPRVYGTVAIVTVFTSILEVFIDGGLGIALIQKKDADDVDFSTVFYFYLSMCITIYFLIYISAPKVALIFRNEELIKVIRVLGISVILSGIKSIQQSYVSRHMMFKKFFFSTIGGTVGSAVLGITLAVLGYGVWALVGQYLFNNLIDTLILWFTVKWRPKLYFSLKRLKGLFLFGWKILVSNIVNTLFNKYRQLVVARFFSTEDLAFFNKGEQLPSMIVLNVNASMDSVLLPAMSNVQDRIEDVKTLTRKTVSLSTYVLSPLLIGFAACAESLIGLVLTEKWLPCTRLLQIICLGYIFDPIQSANMNAIKALGRSDLFLRIDLIRKVIGLFMIFGSIRYGTTGIALSILLASLVSQFVVTIPNKKLLEYGYDEQIKDFLPNLIVALIMGVIVYSVNYLSVSRFIKLIIQVPLGVFIYIALSIIFIRKNYDYLVDKIRSILR